MTTTADDKSHAGKVSSLRDLQFRNEEGTETCGGRHPAKNAIRFADGVSCIWFLDGIGHA